jgi:uncharacterized protein
MRSARPWLFWILALVMLALGISRLRFDVEILNLLPPGLSVTQGLKIYQQHFSNARELLITLEAPSSEEAENAAHLIAQVLRPQTNLVTSVIWQPIWMEEPAQAMELLAYLWLNQPPDVFGELTNRLAVANLTNTLTETRERLATSLSPTDLAFGGYDPYGLTQLPESVSLAAPALGTGEEMFVSPDRTFRLIFVEAASDLSDYTACRAWLAEIQRVVAGARRSGRLAQQVELHYTGRPAFVAEISRSMQNDMGSASAGTLAVIALLFWMTHRRVLPLIWLLVLLLAILAGTLALGGLFFGTVNIVSMGFASILLGLAEDFGIVIYEESRSIPALNGRELRREAAPGIWWSALTTSGAFLMLNLSALPGLGQLGSLVAIGIFLAALVMLYGYTPLVLRFRRSADLMAPIVEKRERLLLFQTSKLLPTSVIWSLTCLVLAAAVFVFWKNGIRIDNSADPLKPKNCEAYVTLDKIRANLARTQEPLWVLVPGQNETEVGQRLMQINATLNHAVAHQLIAGFILPTVAWPQPNHQQANLPAVTELLKEREILRQAALNAGFTSNAFVLTENILDSWQTAIAGNGVYWPTKPASRWLIGRFMARPASGLVALGLIQTTTNALTTKKFVAEWQSEMQHQGIFLTGYNLLGWTVFDLVLRELPLVIVPVFLLVGITLWMAFRNFREVVLSLTTLAFSALCLAAIMDLLQWEWNLLNVMGLPLLLGMGVDFSIHIQLALRRYQGDLLVVRRSVGRALLLAGSTTVAGFGSLVFSSSTGMASLGLICALGITITLLVAVYLLPAWWQAWNSLVPLSSDSDHSHSRYGPR